MTPGAYAANLPPVTQISEKPTVRPFLPSTRGAETHTPNTDWQVVTAALKH